MLILLLLLLCSLSIQSQSSCRIRYLLRNGLLNTTSDISEISNLYLMIDTVDDKSQPTLCFLPAFHLKLPSYTAFVDLAFRQFQDIQRPLTDFLIGRNLLFVTVDSLDVDYDVLLHRDLLRVLRPSKSDQNRSVHLEILHISNPMRKLRIDALSISQWFINVYLTFPCLLINQTKTIILRKGGDKNDPCSSMIDIWEPTVATNISSYCHSNEDITDQVEYVYHYCKKTMLGMFGLFATVMFMIICTLMCRQLPQKHELVLFEHSTSESDQSPNHVF